MNRQTNSIQCNDYERPAHGQWLLPSRNQMGRGRVCRVQIRQWLRPWPDRSSSIIQYGIAYIPKVPTRQFDNVNSLVFVIRYFSLRFQRTIATGFDTCLGSDVTARPESRPHSWTAAPAQPDLLATPEAQSQLSDRVRKLQSDPWNAFTVFAP